MKTYYDVEIQMQGENRATKELIGMIATDLCATPADIEEITDYSATIFFKSQYIMPTVMRQRISAILLMYNTKIHYIDVVYRYENEMTPDRFCFWSDGRQQEYTGHVVFTEDNSNE